MRTMYNAACSCVLYPRGRPWLVGFWKQESVSFRREGLCAGRGVHPAAQAEPNQNGGRVCSAIIMHVHAILASAGRLGSPPARRAADRFLHRPHPGGSRVAINALSGRRGWGPPRRAGGPWSRRVPLQPVHTPGIQSEHEREISSMFKHKQEFPHARPYCQNRARRSWFYPAGQGPLGGACLLSCCCVSSQAQRGRRRR